MHTHPEDNNITNEMLFYLLNNHPRLVDYRQTGTKREWKFEIGQSRDRMYISTIALDLQADVWFFWLDGIAPDLGDRVDHFRRGQDPAARRGVGEGDQGVQEVGP